jgi:hypothetical protein
MVGRAVRLWNNVTKQAISPIEAVGCANFPLELMQFDSRNTEFVAMTREVRSPAGSGEGRNRIHGTDYVFLCAESVARRGKLSANADHFLCQEAD